MPKISPAPTPVVKFLCTKCFLTGIKHQSGPKMFFFIVMNEYFEKHLFFILDETKSIFILLSDSILKESRICQESGTRELTIFAIKL